MTSYDGSDSESGWNRFEEIVEAEVFGDDDPLGSDEGEIEYQETEIIEEGEDGVIIEEEDGIYEEGEIVEDEEIIEEVEIPEEEVDPGDPVRKHLCINLLHST